MRRSSNGSQQTARATAASAWEGEGPPALAEPRVQEQVEVLVVVAGLWVVALGLVVVPAGVQLGGREVVLRVEVAVAGEAAGVMTVMVAMRGGEAAVTAATRRRARAARKRRKWRRMRRAGRSATAVSVRV